MVNTDERPRGILTTSDREYLRMDPEERHEQYTRGNVSKRWQKIEERIQNGIWDLGIIPYHLPESSQEDIFQRLVSTFGPQSTYPRDLMTRSFGFMLCGFLEQTNHDLDDEEYYSRVFEGAIAEAQGGWVNQAETIDVDVTIEGYISEDDPFAPERSDDLASMSEAGIRNLWVAGEITSDEVADALKEKQSREN